MSIQKDLRTGDDGEQKVISILQKSGHEAMKNLDKKTRAFYDIEAILVHAKTDATLAEFTLEVKNDIYALRSGNVAIEFYNSKSNKPSGITMTKADLWVFVIGDDIWITNTKTLRDFVKEKKPLRIVYSGGDSNADMMLYTMESILPVIFKQVNALEPHELTEILLDLLK